MFSSVSRSYGERLKIIIYLDQLVTTRTVSDVNFNFFTMLSFMGSNMGLFLGLGVLQFLEMFYFKLSKIKLLP